MHRGLGLSTIQNNTHITLRLLMIMISWSLWISCSFTTCTLSNFTSYHCGIPWQNQKIWQFLRAFLPKGNHGFYFCFFFCSSWVIMIIKNYLYLVYKRAIMQLPVRNVLLYKLDSAGWYSKRIFSAELKRQKK